MSRLWSLLNLANPYALFSMNSEVQNSSSISLKSSFDFDYAMNNTIAYTIGATNSALSFTLNAIRDTEDPDYFYFHSQFFGSIASY